MPDANTKLLLHFDGTDEDTDTTDSSASNHNPTFAGTAQLDSDQKVFGATSFLVDGDSDFLTIPEHNDFKFGTGNFTIDFRIRFNGANSNVQNFYGIYDDSSNYFSITKWSGTDAGNLQLFVKVGGTDKCNYTVSWNPDVDTWYHLEFVRSSSNVYFFIGGVSQSLTETTAVSTNDLTISGADVHIGSFGTGTSQFVDGWIDEFRVSDVARHTSNFTPPTEQYNGVATGIMTTNTGYWGAI